MKGDLKTPPSEMFQDVVCDSGAPSMDCELCGRTHFCTGEVSDEPDDEIERLRKLATKDPERYCEDADNDGLSFGTIEGMQAVYGCPCNKLNRYEDFIWNHRELIVKYISRRTEKERVASENMQKMLAGI
jgi:hypothetical protein